MNGVQRSTRIVETSAGVDCVSTGLLRNEFEF